MQTVSDRVRMKRLVLSGVGKKVLQSLQEDYGMTEEAAMRLVRNSGAVFGNRIIVAGQPQEGIKSQKKSTEVLIQKAYEEGYRDHASGAPLKKMGNRGMR